MIRLGMRYGYFVVASAALSGAAPAISGDVAHVSTIGSDIAFNAHTGMLYATVPSIAGLPHGNHLIEISPIDASITRSVHVGSEPSTVGASPDAAVAYVGIEGAAAACRVDLDTMTAGGPFDLGRTEDHGPFLYATDIQIMPGSPETIAVSLHRVDLIPHDVGVALFDAGVARPIAIDDNPEGPVWITFGANAGTLYGASTYAPPTLSRMSVSATGVALETTYSQSGSALGRIVFDAGRIYTWRGTVFDETFTTVGAYAASGPVVVDDAMGLAYIVERGRIRVFDRDTFAASYSMPVGDVDDAATAATGCGAGCMGIVFESGTIVVATVDETIFRDAFERVGTAQRTKGKGTKGTE